MFMILSGIFDTFGVDSRVRTRVLKSGKGREIESPIFKTLKRSGIWAIG